VLLAFFSQRVALIDTLKNMNQPIRPRWRTSDRKPARQEPVSLRSIPTRTASFERIFECVVFDFFIHPDANLFNSNNPL
jgi:hypothetical protein